MWAAAGTMSYGRRDLKPAHKQKNNGKTRRDLVVECFVCQEKEKAQKRKHCINNEMRVQHFE